MVSPVTARPAATVLLLRDTPAGLNVFMVVRHHAIDFASGALVFPGGRVDEADHVILGQPDAFRVAAIRETFEECGILLARLQGSDQIIPADHAAAIEALHRAALCCGEISFADIVTAQKLSLATDLLVPFAHWITPVNQPKRYDTQFFLIAAPLDQLGMHDGGEAVDSVWIPPRQALAETEAGQRKLVFATQMNLIKLARHTNVADALAAAAAAPVVTVQPEVTPIAGTRSRELRIPIEADYGGDRFVVDLPPAS